MQLSLNLRDHVRPQETWAPPLCPVPDTTYRVEIRLLWNPLMQRGTAAMEITDDDTRELIAWRLLPGAKSLQDLAWNVSDFREALMEALRYLDEPF